MVAMGVMVVVDWLALRLLAHREVLTEVHQPQAREEKCGLLKEGL